MSAIGIPYLPIRNFKESVVCEKYTEAYTENKEDINATVDKSLLFTEQQTDVCADVVLILHGMGMEKYIENFQKEKVSLETFILLNDADLQELGISSAKDRKIIIKNLEVHQTNKKEFVVSENHAEDLRIAKNVFNQLLLLQNYCAYVELQMKKHQLTDYRIGWKDSACAYLKAFTESAVTQSKRLSASLFVGSHSNHLIGKILSMYNLTLPEHLEKKLKSNKRSGWSTILRVTVAVGMCSVILLTGKCMLQRK